jgi:hypothetical protein
MALEALQLIQTTAKLAKSGMLQAKLKTVRAAAFGVH